MASSSSETNAQPCYTILTQRSIPQDSTDTKHLRNQLQSSNIGEKQNAMKTLLVCIAEGDHRKECLMDVIKFIMPQRDHTLKKLCLLYWELLPNKVTSGKLLPELLLVVDSLLRDVKHANEFIRGCTLRFLCKLSEVEILGPLLPSVRAALEDKDRYVRRNAVMTIATVFQRFPNLIPDAPELVHNFLNQEGDGACQRNAFLMLAQCDQDRAVDYLADVVDRVKTFGDIMQLAFVELITKVCRQNPSERGRFVRCIFMLLQASSASVRFAAANALVGLAPAATAIQQAAKVYIDLCVKQSDINVKLVVLDRITGLSRDPRHEHVMQGLIMNMTVILLTPSLEVRKKVLTLLTDLVTDRKVDDVVAVLGKEMSKASSGNFEGAVEYRQELVKTLHLCGVKFPRIAQQVVPTLLDIVADCESGDAGVDVIDFVREAVHRFPELRVTLMPELMGLLGKMQHRDIQRATLWILAEYTGTRQELACAMEAVKAAIGPLPILPQGQPQPDAQAEESGGAAAKPASHRVAVKLNSDGTYASQSGQTISPKDSRHEVPAIRKLLLQGEFMVGAALASTLAKLAIRFKAVVGPGEETNRYCGDAMLICASVLRLGKATQIDEDSFERIITCIRVLSNPTDELCQVFLDDSRTALNQYLKSRNDISSEDSNCGTDIVQTDSKITFALLEGGAKVSTTFDDDAEKDLQRAVADNTTEQDLELSSKSRLNKVVQLTGFNDPLYVEAFVDVNQFDVALDFIVINQTPDTLQNVTLELTTCGDLRLVEKPRTYTIGPRDTCNIKVHIKVNSTDDGTIFGSIVYDLQGATSDRNCVVLNEIHIDVINYMRAASLSEATFRSLWATADYVISPTVDTVGGTLLDFLDHVKKVTNMKCLTSEDGLKDECAFLTANLFGKSIFGEEALANLSIEKDAATGRIHGYVKIRSSTNGILLSLRNKLKER